MRSQLPPATPFPRFCRLLIDMSIEHIAFDLDGTLVDTRDQIVESLMACLTPGQRTESARSEFYRNVHRSPKSVLREYDISDLNAYWRHHARLTEYSRLFFDDATQTLATLKEEGISLSLITSLPSQPARRLLQSHDLERFFNCIDTFASRRFRKPSPKLLAVHLDDLDISCENAAYVGDSEGDMRMARGAGSAAWGAGWGSLSEAALRRAGADRVLPSLQYLLRTVL